MKTKRRPGLKMIGLFLIILGPIIATFTWQTTSQTESPETEAIPKSGRILSRSNLESYSLRILADTSPDPNLKNIRAIEVPVSERKWHKSPVGSQASFFILPDGSPTMPLEKPPRKNSLNPGYFIAAFTSLLGLFLIAWPRHQPSPSPTPPQEELPKAKLPPKKAAPKKIPTPSPDEPPPLPEKIPLKDTTLYDGAFEFSYSAEKTRITLPCQTELRINQYRPLADLVKVLPNRDLLHILRTAKSEWRISDSETGPQALARLVSEKEITSADQFFLNQNHLGIMFRDEVENGHWLAWLRGVWKIHPPSKDQK